VARRAETYESVFESAKVFYAAGVREPQPRVGASAPTLGKGPTIVLITPKVLAKHSATMRASGTE
jgi:hypothetical protein